MTTEQTTELGRRAALIDDRIEQYARMVEIRDFEERVNDLFAAGSINGTTHLCLGQEALAVGLATVLRPSDVVSATYRGHGIALALGMTPRTALAEIMGRAEGCTGGVGGSMHMCDITVGLLPTFAIVGAGLPIASGAALAFQNRGEDNVAVAICGDGATNIGAFHEALNLASVWKLPVVFIIDNNNYGEYTRINLTTPFEDLHRRAASYDIPGVVVDGMDVLAVQSTIATAVARARAGEGPSLIEAKTYRFAGHSRADTAPYRPDGELEAWQKRDPLLVTREAIIASGAADASTLDNLESAIRVRLEGVVTEVESLPSPSLQAMFENVWAAGVR